MCEVSDGEIMNDNGVVESVQRDAREYGDKFTRYGLENLVNPHNEDDAIEELTMDYTGQ